MDENKSTQTVTETVTTQKSKLVAFLLWLFLGGLGAHRYYCGKVGTGVVILILTVIGIFTSGIVIGIPILAVVGIWLIVDLVRILTGGLVTGTTTQTRTISRTEN